MSFHSKTTTLPAEDIRLLAAMQVKVKYIPKSRDENFYRVMLDKFRILALNEYRRVLFLDGDVVPLVNLNYLFELSDPTHTTTPTVLMENLVVAMVGSSCLHRMRERCSKSIASFILEKTMPGTTGTTRRVQKMRRGSRKQAL
jgi:alpha-N-acetylglucosamine transferase